MWSHERQEKILELLASNHKVSTNALSVAFDVSRETIRRDLMEMEQQGVLLRVHGGAKPIGALIEPEATFAQRQEQFHDQKQAIARLACNLIPLHSTCFIDGGTTTSVFARHVAARGDIRVITNSLEIAQIMASGQNCDVLLLGGRPHSDVPATYGEMTLSQIDRFLADFAVISPTGLHQDRGATDYELHEAEVARAMMRRARACVMLCHSDKIGTESRVSICRLDEVDHLVTDTLPRGQEITLPRGTVHRATPEP
jgi:DeoR/GlpR family transcriptional regulator of sugar metabolism